MVPYAKRRMDMKVRRFFAWIVTALMLLTSIALPGPLSAIREAEAATVDQASISAPAAKESTVKTDGYYDDCGWCGDNLYWDFYEYSGELIITGSGRMYDYWEDGNPWCDNGFASKVLTVSLPKGITNLGAYAFYGLTALKEITLPSTVKTIDESAFEECTALRSITLPRSVTAIGPWAFYNCSSLNNVYYQSKAEDGVKIVIQRGNSCLLNAAWHYSKPSTATLKIKTQPKSVKVDEGKTAVFKAKASGAKVIKWQYQKPNDSYWYDWGVTGESISVLGTTLYDGYRFRVAASNGSTTLYSSAATLTVKPVTLAIKSQPKSIIKVNEGKSFTVKVNAVGATCYTWWVKWADEDDWSNWSGTNTQTFTCSYPEWFDGMLIYCVVSNDRGGQIASNMATVYVNLSIKQQPKSVTIEEEDYGWFYVDAPGATAYQWQYRAPNSNYWWDWDGETSFYLCVYGSMDNSGYSFRCRVSNLSGEKYTKAAKLTVNPKIYYRALLIGESNYSSNPLYGASYNVDAMDGMLKGLNNSFTTTILKNASRSQILNGIDTAFSGASDYDVSLFYYSGHGGSSSYRPELGALCPISGSWIWMYELANKLSNVKGRVIVILDSCHSGAAIGKGDGDSQAMEDMLDTYNQSVIDAFAGAAAEKYGELATSKFVVLTSAAAAEVGWAANGWGPDGSGYPQFFYTAALIKGMGCTYPYGEYSGSMAADRNKDKLITLKEIYNYSYNQTLTWNKQRHTDTLQHSQCYGNASEVLFRRK